MSLVAGRSTVFKLDNSAGALIDVSAFFKSLGGMPGKAERLDTQTFGQSAKRRQVIGVRDGGPISLQGFYQRVAGTLVHGRTARILSDQYALNVYLKTANVSRSIDLPATKALGDTFERRGVPGLKDGSIACSGFFDSVALGPDVTLWNYLTTSTPAIVTMAPAGTVIGELVELVQAVEGGYTIDSNEENVTTFSADFQADDAIEVGHSLRDVATAETAAAPVNNVGVDLTAVSSVAGWVAHLHVVAWTGTSAVVKLQDSADNSAWADLTNGTFTTVTSTTAQRIDGGTTATVRRYVRCIISAATYTSMTYTVSFSQRGGIAAAGGTYKGLYELLGHPNTQTFEYGPEGSVAGKIKYTGECRMSKLDMTLSEDGIVELSCELQTDAAVTRTTF